MGRRRSDDAAEKQKLIKLPELDKAWTPKLYLDASRKTIS